MIFQDPQSAGTQAAEAASAAQKASQAADAVNQAMSISSIEWIDWTAIVLLAVFFLLGLFKGFWWQVSRVVTLVAAWVLAGQFGPSAEPIFAGWFDPAGNSPAELPLFLAYVAIFLLTVVVLSIVSMLLAKLIKESGLSFYDRVGGAVLGLGTGSVAVIAILAGIYMFVPQRYPVVKAAQRSHTMDYSQKTLRMMGNFVPEPMKKVFEVDESGAKSGKPGEKSGQVPGDGADDGAKKQLAPGAPGPTGPGQGK